jgi:hypothetical protein
MNNLFFDTKQTACMNNMAHHHVGAQRHTPTTNTLYNIYK